MEAMSPVVDATADGRDRAVDRAVLSVRAGDVVVLPTDTVYGIGCDAFSAAAVARVLAAKGRGREMPPPVLVPDARTVDGLATGLQPYVRPLIAQYWPGPLTLVVTAQSSLHWDLGETEGTVALRMPDDEVALAVLAQAGPMAVTSANRTGQPAATTVLEAATQLGDAVDLYVDGGPRSSQQPSTIVDCTGEVPVVLREGTISAEDVERVTAASLPRDRAGEGPGASADEPVDEPGDEPRDVSGEEREGTGGAADGEPAHEDRLELAGRTPAEESGAGAPHEEQEHHGQ